MNIKIVGCISSKHFHISKFIMFNLVKHRPDLITKYIVKGIMDIEWKRCLWKLNQNLGGMRRQTTVAIFINKNYIGTDVEFQEYLIAKYKFTIDVMWTLNYKQLISTDIQNYYNNKKLLDQLVPETCKYFKQLCLNKTEGYLNSSIYRVDTSNGFLQAGRINNRIPYLKTENYIVNHDRRGVLSLASRNTSFNGPEFIISLQSNSWMNNKYVAFGHAVEGEKTLKMIEKLSNIFNTFKQMQIRINSCDVLLNCADRPTDKTELLETFLRSTVSKSVSKAMYIHLYGKPELLHFPIVTDFQYMKLIVRAIMKKVLLKIENLPLTTASTYDSDSKSIPSIRTDWDEMEDECILTNLRPYSNVDINNDTDGIVSLIPGLSGKLLVKSKRANSSKIPTSTYGVQLPTNHKDYWRLKNIYESITK